MTLEQGRSFRNLAQAAVCAIGFLALTAHAQAPLPVTLTKSFSPSSIVPNGQSVLAVNVTNGTGAQVNGVQFRDDLPVGVTTVTFGSPTFGPGCVGGNSATIGGTYVAGSVNVAANATCTELFVVTAASVGVYTNSPSNFSIWNGTSLTFSPVALTVAVPPIPTLSQFALILLALGIAALALRGRKRFVRR